MSGSKTYSAPSRRSSFVRISCDVCGSAEYRGALRCEGFAYVRCLGCGVTYQNPQPSAESLRARYRNEYFQYEIENERNFYNLMLLGLADIDLDGLPGLASRGLFLDVGCATGMLLEHMRGKGWTPKGVELCPESARYATERRGLDVFVGTLEEARLPEASVKVAHFSHLLEHVTEPLGFLREVRRILDPRGYAVITTPNIKGLQARLLGSRWRSAIADHLYLFSPATLARALRSASFEVGQTVTWGGIAKGLAPPFVKVPLDRAAKRLGFGDVMLFLAIPR